MSTENKTPLAKTTEPSRLPSNDLLGSVETPHPRYIVALRGGTILRLPGGIRSPACEYDKLLALLDACEILQRPTDWDAPVEGWTGGKWGIVGACTERSSLVSDILPNAPISHARATAEHPNPSENP